MKRKLLFLISILLIFITACSTNKATPNEQMDTYIEQWNDSNFKEMYEMLSIKSTETYKTDQFVDRYEKVYTDLDISKLKVSYEELENDDLKTAIKEGVVTFPITVAMESLAGPITFDYKVQLLKEMKDDKESWVVSWDPGLIFPALKDGGKINIKTELPRRGDILDRNKMPLAINDVVYEIGIVPESLGENTDNIKKRAAELLNMSVDAIDLKLDAGWVKPNQFVPLKQVPKTKEAILSELWTLDGITSRDVLGRVYPLGTSAAHLVGYIGPVTAEDQEKLEPGDYGDNDLIGKRGLEQLYEKDLIGKKGAKISITKEDTEEVILAERPAEDGENISVTIDANIQELIYESYDGKAGTAAAIDPKSGETLALVSSPAFDPNELLYGMSNSQWDALQDNPQKPMINRFSAKFAPGSVIKPITAAIGLKNGSIKPDDGIEIKGLTWGNGKGWGNYEVRRVSSTNKPVDLADALKRSDNIYFAKKAIEMGSKEFITGLEQFQFGEKLPIDYPITSSSISADGTLDGEVQLANTSYGQAEIEMSALHLALTYTPFLNDGNMIKPTFLTSEETGQVWQEQLITAEQATLMQKYLRDVVVKGTAKKSAMHEELAISGKTGTAELKLSLGSKGHENGWFVGYPTEEQDILIAMMMEEVENFGSSGFVTKQVADILLELNKP